MKGMSELQVQLVSLTRKGKPYPLPTDFLEAKGESSGKQNCSASIRETRARVGLLSIRMFDTYA